MRQLNTMENHAYIMNKFIMSRLCSIASSYVTFNLFSGFLICMLHKDDFHCPVG